MGWIYEVLRGHRGLIAPRNRAESAALGATLKAVIIKTMRMAARSLSGCAPQQQRPRSPVLDAAPFELATTR
jgi:hypothetical protein